MSRTGAKFTQADLGRAIREMRKVFGSAQVIFDASGNARVVPISEEEIARLTSVTGAVKPVDGQEGVELW